MSRISVECPLRMATRCGNPCGFETRASKVIQLVKYGDAGSAVQIASRQARQFAADTGCPPKVINKVMRG